MRVGVIILAALLTACSSGGGGGSSGNKDRDKKPSTDPMQWYAQYGEPNPKFDSKNSFTWKEGDEPHYVLRNHAGQFKGDLTGKTLTVTYRIDVLDGTPDFQSTECGERDPKNTGRAALMIRKNSDNAETFNRAWYGVRPNLEPGTWTITAPLSGEGWSFVNAGESPSTHQGKWKDLIANVRDVALTFNGCSSAGHGAHVKGGNARFTILSVTIS